MSDAPSPARPRDRLIGLDAGYATGRRSGVHRQGAGGVAQAGPVRLAHRPRTAGLRTPVATARRLHRWLRCAAHFDNIVGWTPPASTVRPTSPGGSRSRSGSRCAIDGVKLLAMRRCGTMRRERRSASVAARARRASRRRGLRAAVPPTSSSRLLHRAAIAHTNRISSLLRECCTILRPQLIDRADRDRRVALGARATHRTVAQVAAACWVPELCRAASSRAAGADRQAADPRTLETARRQELPLIDQQPTASTQLITRLPRHRTEGRPGCWSRRSSVGAALPTGVSCAGCLGLRPPRPYSQRVSAGSTRAASAKAGNRRVACVAGRAGLEVRLSLQPTSALTAMVQPALRRCRQTHAAGGHRGAGAASARSRCRRYLQNGELPAGAMLKPLAA